MPGTSGPTLVMNKDGVDMFSLRLKKFLGSIKIHMTVNYERQANANVLHFPQNQQVEPVCAVNPLNFRNVIAGAMDKTNYPDCLAVPAQGFLCPPTPGLGVPGMGIYTSFDIGQTWSTQYPVLRNLVGGQVQSLIADPIIAFGPAPANLGEAQIINGFSTTRMRAYFGGITGPEALTAVASTVAVIFSDDGGANWSDGSYVAGLPTTGFFTDRPNAWADLSRTSPFYGYLYVTYTLTQFFGTPLVNRIVSVISRSRDGGQSFDPFVIIQSPIQPAPGVPGITVVSQTRSFVRTTTDGRVYVFYNATPSNTTTSAVYGAVSTDAGLTFTNFQVAIQRPPPGLLPGASFATSGARSPFPAIDENNNIYIVWTDYNASQAHGTITLASALSVNGVQPLIPSFNLRTIVDIPGRTPLFASIATSRNQVFVGMMAFDDRPPGTRPGPGVVTYDAYFVTFRQNLSSIRPPVRISAVSSDADTVAQFIIVGGPCGQFIGDYTYAAAAPNGNFFYAWTDARNAQSCPAQTAYSLGGCSGESPNINALCSPAYGNTDIFVARISP